ncbi:Thioredoxin domain-containing protein [Aphelenchoides besseyi]|nr:Thioredoxin domain-containing protein [Aphelenchoides besseyi]
MLRSIFRLPSINSTVLRFSGVRSISKIDVEEKKTAMLDRRIYETKFVKLYVYLQFHLQAVLVFFSAGWCPSCKEFTPYLKEFYENTKNEGLQVVWVSRDRSEEDQIEYYEKNLPDWPYLPYGTKELRLAIKLVKSDGEVADDGARVKIEKNYKDPEAAKKIVADWRKKVGLDGN